MPELKFVLPGPETVTLSGQTIEKLLRAGDGDAALLYLYILLTRGQKSPEEAAEAMGKGRGSIISAMAVLSRLGLAAFSEPDDKPPAIPPEPPRGYTADEINRGIEADASFSMLVNETKRSLGKALTPDDLERLFRIYDELRLPPEVILLLITHCITESRGHGGGRMPSMRYIEKAASTWESEEVFSLDKAESYLKALEIRKSARGEIKNALQIRDREFSASEKRYVDGWIKSGFSADAVEIAYDRTVLNTGKLSWGYMDSILSSWHGKGLHTPQEIADKDGKQSRGLSGKDQKEQDNKYGASDLDELERMKRLLKKIRED